jgi:hypothetical protein
LTHKGVTGGQSVKSLIFWVYLKNPLLVYTTFDFGFWSIHLIIFYFSAPEDAGPSSEPKRKKYAKEAWPGRKPGLVPGV